MWYKMLMFAKRQINPNKTKHEHVPINTRDIKINPNRKHLHKGGRWPRPPCMSIKEWHCEDIFWAQDLDSSIKLKLSQMTR
jgi:hypothetical protein